MYKKGVCIVAVLLVSVATLYGIPVAYGSGWVKIYGTPTTYLCLYDIDGDGKLEIVGAMFIMDNNSTVEIIPSVVFKTDFDGDGVPDLVMYTPSTGKLTIIGSKVRETLELPKNIKNIRVFSNGFTVGNYVFGGGNFMIVNASNPVPVVMEGKLYATYVDPRLGLVLRSSNSTESVFPVSKGAVIVSAGVWGGYVYFLVTANRSTAIIRYDLDTGDVAVTVYGIVAKWGAFFNGTFLAGTGTGIYRISFDGIRMVAPAEATYFPVGARFIAYYNSPYVTLMTPSGKVVKKVEVFEKPVALDYDNGTIVMSTASGVYEYSENYPYVEISAPAVVLVGEPFTIKVNGTYTSLKLYVDGKVYTATTSPATFNVTINQSGKQAIIVDVCKSGMCFSTQKEITVAPRKLKIVVLHPPKVDPYGKLNLTVETYDAETGRKVKNTMCYLKLPATNTVLRTKPFTPVAVDAVPIGMEVPVDVTCWSSTYALTEKSVTVPVSRPYMNVTLTYLGGGRFLVKAYNTVTKKQFAGTLVIHVDNGKPEIYTNQGMVQVPPGEHTIHVVLTKGNVVYLKTSVKVMYYQNISEVPQGEEVTVADRPVTHTVTKTVSHVMTVTKPKIVEVEKVNPPLAIGLVILGLGIGVTSSLLLPKRVRK